jgi:hypothetical protein
MINKMYMADWPTSAGYQESKTTEERRGTSPVELEGQTEN